MLKNVYKKYYQFLYLFLFLSICLTSCYPFFKNPLPPPSELKVDPQLSGAWILTTQSGHKQELFIFPRSTGWFDLLYVSNIDGEDSSKGIEVSIMEGYGTSVNKDKFLCLRLRNRDFTDPNEEKNINYMIVNYEITDNNELNIKLFSGEKVKNLIKDGKLKGEIVTEDALKDDILGLLFKGVFTYEIFFVTASPDELKEVITKESIKAFLATSSDELPNAFSELGIGSFVGPDKIFFMTFKKAKLEEKDIK
jgi:hypothetical protein